MKLSKLVLSSLLLASTHGVAQTKVHYEQADTIKQKPHANHCQFPWQFEERRAIINAEKENTDQKPDKRQNCPMCGKG